MEASGGETPPLLKYITTEDVDDCFVVMRDCRVQRTSTNLLLTLRHRYKNVCTCAYTYMHLCIYTCIIYRDAFRHELNVFIKYLLRKKNTHTLPCSLVFLNIPLPPSLFPANGQAALNVGRILW